MGKKSLKYENYPLLRLYDILDNVFDDINLIHLLCEYHKFYHIDVKKDLIDFLDKAKNIQNNKIIKSISICIDEHNLLNNLQIKSISICIDQTSELNVDMYKNIKIFQNIEILLVNINNLIYFDINYLSVIMPKLKHITINNTSKQYYNFVFGLLCFPNMTHLKIINGNLRANLKRDTDNLTSLFISYEGPVDLYDLSKMTKLKQITIKCTRFCYSDYPMDFPELEEFTSYLNTNNIKNYINAPKLKTINYLEHYPFYEEDFSL